MKGNTTKKTWGIVDFNLVDQGVPHLEAMVFHYIARFERNKKIVYASIPYVAKNLRLSERSTQRYIRNLIKLGFLKETTEGRTRYLQTTHAKLAPTPAKLAGDPCQNGVNDPCQIGMLSIKDISIKNINKSLPIKPISKPSPKRTNTGVVKGETSTTIVKSVGKPLNAQARDWLYEMTGVSLDEVPD